MVVDGSPLSCGKETSARAAKPREIAAIHRESRLVHLFVRHDESVRAFHEKILFRDGTVAYGRDGLAELSECAAQRKSAGDRVAVGIGVTVDCDVVRAFQHLRYLLQLFVHFSSSSAGGMSMVFSRLSILMP